MITIRADLPHPLFLKKAEPKGHKRIPWASFLLSYPLERYHLTPALLRRIRRFQFRLGRGRFHEAADFLRRASLHIVGDVRIGIEGEPGTEVAQHTGQRFHIHAAEEGHGGEGVTQIVKSDLLAPGPLQNDMEPTEHGTRCERHIQILRRGEQLLIPINMRDGSLLCMGKGNEDWNCSAPHGTGRLMSRADAKQSFTVSEFKKQMAEVYTTSVSKATLDECPMAYKGMQDILDNIGPTADVVKIIRPIYNFKAGEED